MMTGRPSTRFSDGQVTGLAAFLSEPFRSCSYQIVVEIEPVTHPAGPDALVSGSTTRPNSRRRPASTRPCWFQGKRDADGDDQTSSNTAGGRRDVSKAEGDGGNIDGGRPMRQFSLFTLVRNSSLLQLLQFGVRRCRLVLLPLQVDTTYVK